jgi:hypothetical protein
LYNVIGREEDLMARWGGDWWEESSYDLEELEDLCTGCGFNRSEWKGNKGQGYISGGEFYCCKSCANDIGCMCEL